MASTQTPAELPQFLARRAPAGHPTTCGGHTSCEACGYNGDRGSDDAVPTLVPAPGVEYRYAERCEHPDSREGDGIHIGGEPSDLICLASPLGADTKSGGSDAE